MTDPNWRKLPRKPGAGRKPQLAGGTVKTSVSLSADDREYLRAIDDNLSGAIRKVIQENQTMKFATTQEAQQALKNAETVAEIDEIDAQINAQIYAGTLPPDAAIELPVRQVAQQAGNRKGWGCK